MHQQIYSNLTESLLFYLVTGMLLGLTVGMGVLFIESVDAWTIQEFELSAAVILVSVSSFFVAPLASIITGSYLGYSNPSEEYLLMFAVFSSFVGFFIVNIASLSSFLLSTGQPVSPLFLEANDALEVYYTFLGWENRAALLSAPALITGLAAAQLGKSYNQFLSS